MCGPLLWPLLPLIFERRPGWADAAAVTGTPCSFHPPECWSERRAAILALLRWVLCTMRRSGPEGGKNPPEWEDRACCVKDQEWVNWGRFARVEKDMPDPVAIVGIHQSRYQAQRDDVTLEELIFDGSTRVLEDLGLTIADVDGVVTAASDLVDGRVISSMVTSGPAGAYMKDYTNLSSSGEHALTLAYMRTLAGQFQTTLVMSWSKCSETKVPLTEDLGMDPFYQRGLGMDGLAAAAMQADAYRTRWSVPDRAVAQVTAGNRANALNNPLAHLREPVTADQVLASPVVAWPLHEMEVPPYSDGVCAMVVASDARAAELCAHPAWIKGAGWASDTYWLGDRDPSELASLKAAASQAYAMAGITDPVREIDVAEIHDLTAYHQLMACEALRFCDEGEAAILAESGTTSPDGDLPINPSGGVLSSNPVFASGLVRTAEAALQVMGCAGPRQVRGVEVALAHATHGLAGQGNTVFILGREA